MISQRENFMNLLRRKGIAYAPPGMHLCPAQEEEFKRRYGNDAQYAEVYEFPDRSVLNNLCRQDFTDWKKRYYPATEFSPKVVFDLWGIAHDFTKESMHMSRMYHPMETFETMADFISYPFVEYSHESESEAKKEIDAIHAKGLAATAQMACTIWETSWYLRGMEKLMMDMMCDDDCAVFLLDKVTSLVIARIESYTRAGVDHIHLGDDIGMQKTIMMSESLYCKYLKPRLSQVISAAKKINPNVVISYHSCGYVTPFIPHLIEAGIDVLNPVQPECMDFKELHTQFGGKLSFWGTIGTQTTMPYGTVDEVRRVTLENLAIAGAKGGLYCTPTHLIEPEVPFANIEAYVNACKEFKA